MQREITSDSPLPGPAAPADDRGAVAPHVRDERPVVSRSPPRLGLRPHQRSTRCAHARRPFTAYPFARSTIYRHWPDKLALITDALEVLNQQPMPRLDDETPRTRVHTLLAHLARALTGSPLSSCVPARIDAAEHNSDVREFHDRYHAQRCRALVKAIGSGVAAGDFPPATDPELAAHSLAGAIFYRRLMTREPFDPDRVDELVDLVLGPPA
jgi:TetR/AcrR family transcriptional regulator, regulator of autoinduction and epiphytic fitness